MTSTISDLHRFQLNYLFQLTDNIPEERLYEKQLDGFNSAGWILGHICVEAEDILHHFDIKFERNDYWNSLFRNTTGKISSIDNLPSKAELITGIRQRYEKLDSLYCQLSTEERKAPHPSAFLKNVLSDMDAWFAHHLTTHIAVHCGNLVVWKKMVGIEVGGY